MNNKNILENHPIPVKIKLSLLWAILIGLYIYNDYFSMYLPGTIENMSTGQLGSLGDATQDILIAVSLILAIPALMIFMSSALPPIYCRWLNILLGFVYTTVEVLTFVGSYIFYQIVVVFEITATLLIIYYAVNWPKHNKKA